MKSCGGICSLCVVAMAVHGWWCRVLSTYCSAVWRAYDTWLLILSCLLRVSTGRSRATGVEKCQRPKELLALYDCQACPKCRVVRETLSVLDIDHMVYPCPKESIADDDKSCLNSRYRLHVKTENGGIIKLPFLEDPNRGLKLSGEEEIVSFLWKTYGDKAARPTSLVIANLPAVKCLSLGLSQLCRPLFSMGRLRAASRKPQKPLELWGYESSPFVELVQETLSTCELPHVARVLPFGSTQKRIQFSKDHSAELSGRRRQWSLIKVPFLRDPNTGVELFESRAIVEYLQMKYQTAPVPDDGWLRSNLCHL